MKKIKSNNSFKIVALIAVVAIAAVNVKIALQDYVPALHSGLTLKNIEAEAQSLESESKPIYFKLTLTREGKRVGNESDGGENTGSDRQKYGDRKDKYKETAQCVISSGYSMVFDGTDYWGIKGGAGASVPFNIGIKAELNVSGEKGKSGSYTVGNSTTWISLGSKVACFDGGKINCLDSGGCK